MRRGFILINTEPTREYEVYINLSRVPEIIELNPLFGEYDLIATIEVEDYEKLGKVVVDEILSLKGVRDTKTYC